MNAKFLYERYAKENEDLSAAFGVDKEAELQNHFYRFGRNEARGFAVSEHLNVEAAFFSDQGDILLVGWADRRVISQLQFTIDVGYFRYDVSSDCIVWYNRPDVGDLVGDFTTPFGFFCLFKIPLQSIHPCVTVFVNGKEVYNNSVVRYKSINNFLQTALGAGAVMADVSVGESMESAAKLIPAFSDVWERFLRNVRYSIAFEHSAASEVTESIIITVYRNADMLIRQLEDLSNYLCKGSSEVIIVGNELRESEQIITQLTAFCQIYNVDITMFLCSVNSGFSAANNFAAEKARGRVLVFMNPDIFPPEGFETAAFSFLESDPKDALHGTLLYFGEGLLMHSGVYCTYDIAVDARAGKTEKVLRVEHYGKGLSANVSDETFTQRVRNTSDGTMLVSAALWKIRKDVFMKAGGLSTKYLFAYYEDADFCLRYLESGGKIVLDETSRWLHMEGIGKPKPPSMRTFMWLNRARFSERFRDSEFLLDPTADQELL